MGLKLGFWSKTVVATLCLTLAVGCGDDPVDNPGTPDTGTQQDSGQQPEPDAGTQPDTHLHDVGEQEDAAPQQDVSGEDVSGTEDTSGGEDDASGGEDVEPADDAGNATVSFSGDVLPLIGGCSGCHGASGGLNLSAANAYNNLVGVDAAGCSGEVRVIAGNAENSYLIKKIEGRQGAGCGGTMHPSVSISATNIAIIRQWIDDGALNN